MTAEPLAPLRDFVTAMTALVDRTDDEAALLAGARPLLAQLIADDAWLPEECAKPDPQFYRQYLLHCDPRERFSVVSFVWGPGQKTPIHDHTVWGLVAVGSEEVIHPGDIEAVSPTVGDVHTVANDLADRSSISIHVYGANIGAVRRHVFDAATGAPNDFVSGYSSAFVPNLWDRSAAVRAALT